MFSFGISMRGLRHLFCAALFFLATMTMTTSTAMNIYENVNVCKQHLNLHFALLRIYGGQLRSARPFIRKRSKLRESVFLFMKDLLGRELKFSDVVILVKHKLSIHVLKFRSAFLLLHIFSISLHVVFLCT